MRNEHSTLEPQMPNMTFPQLWC